MLRPFLLALILATLSACTTSGGSSALITGSDADRGTYSSYGGDVQYDESLKLHYVDVFVGGGGTEGGAIRYARPKIDDYGMRNKLGAGTVIRSEYTFFPLSKFRVFVRYG